MFPSIPLNWAQNTLKTTGNPAALYVFAVSQARENFKKSLFPSLSLGSASKEEQRGADWSCRLDFPQKNGRKKRRRNPRNCIRKFIFFLSVYVLILTLWSSSNRLLFFLVLFVNLRRFRLGFHRPRGGALPGSPSLPPPPWLSVPPSFSRISNAVGERKKGGGDWFLTVSQVDWAKGQDTEV